MMSPSVLYFHGFASSPASAKITALRPLLEPDGITLNTPDLNIPSFEKLDFDAIVAHAMNVAREDPPRALVGSSMGALIALAVPLDVPRVLIAPALGMARRWRDYVPDGDPVLMFNYARNEKVPIHRAFFEQIANVHVDDEPPRSRVTVIMGRKDESVPFAYVAEVWERWQQSGKLAPGSKFIELAEGDHGLIAHADAIREAIVEATVEATS